MEASGMSKKTKGRQRIEIKKLENKNSLEVTFSKRKKGIFNKASELSLLCDAQVAIIMMSPHNRPFSYGHPSVEALLDRFFSGNNDPFDQFSTNNEGFRMIKHEIERLQDQLEEEEKISKEIKHRNESNHHAWWEQPTDDMRLEELVQFVKSLEQLRSDVAARVNQKPNNDHLAIVAKSDGDHHHEASVVNQLTDQCFINDIPPLNFFFDDGNFFDSMDI